MTSRFQRRRATFVPPDMSDVARLRTSVRLPERSAATMRDLVTVRWPADSPVGVIGDAWRRLPDGRLEARYTPEQLALVLAIAGQDVSAADIRNHVAGR